MKVYVIIANDLNHYSTSIHSIYSDKEEAKKVVDTLNNESEEFELDVNFTSSGYDVL